MKAHNRELRRYQRKDSKSISVAEEEEIRQAFDIFDYEHRGRIDYRSLKAACRALGFQTKKKDVLEALKRFDKGQESTDIDFDIFYQILSQDFYLGRTFDDLVERAWQIFETKGPQQGRITYSSLRSVVKDLKEQLDDDELHDMINTFASDQDGALSKADFRRVLRVYDPNHDPLDDD